MGCYNSTVINAPADKVWETIIFSVKTKLADWSYSNVFDFL